MFSFFISFFDVIPVSKQHDKTRGMEYSRFDMSLVVKKTGLRGFRPGLTQTGLYSQRRWLEACNFVFMK